MLQKDGQLPQAKPMLVAIESKFSNEGDLMQALCNKMASKTLSWWRNVRAGLLVDQTLPLSPQ